MVSFCDFFASLLRPICSSAPWLGLGLELCLCCGQSAHQPLSKIPAPPPPLPTPLYNPNPNSNPYTTPKSDADDTDTDSDDGDCWPIGCDESEADSCPRLWPTAGVRECWRRALGASSTVAEVALALSSFMAQVRRIPRCTDPNPIQNPNPSLLHFCGVRPA